MLKKETLVKMAEIRDKWCVSIYMPISRVDANKNKIRLKNMMAEAEKKLLELEMNPQKIARLLAPMEMILFNNEFWQDRKDGFVSFFTSDSFVWYSLPYKFKELVVVTDRLHLKPLLRNTSQSRSFHILTLSQTELRFYEASEMGIGEVHLKGLPRSFGSILNTADEKHLQMHSGGGGAAIFHGQGGGEDNKKRLILELFHRANKVISDYLKKNESPLLLAGVEYLQPIYREANTYPHLLEDGITGNVDKLSTKSLLKKAFPFVQPVFRLVREEAQGVYEEKLGTGLASDNFPEVFKASLNGRVDTLFVPVGKQKWGTFDDQTNEISIHQQALAGDKDLLCVASTNTLLTGGKVFAVLPEQMPNNASIAAVLRY